MITRFIDKQEPVPPLKMFKPRSFPEIEALAARTS
jgi:hypothetical protein